METVGIIVNNSHFVQMINKPFFPYICPFFARQLATMIHCPISLSSTLPSTMWFLFVHADDHSTSVRLFKQTPLTDLRLIVEFAISLQLCSFTPQPILITTMLTPTSPHHPRWAASRFLPLLLLLLTFVQHQAHAQKTKPPTTRQVRQFVDPDDLPVDPDDSIVVCSNFGTRGSPPVACPSGQSCVINNFGNPPVDLPDSGFCVDSSTVNPSPLPCSLSQCALNGGSTVCTLNRKLPPSSDIIPSTASGLTTCATWSKLSVSIGNEQINICNQFACTLDCPNDAVSSLGRVFCNACNLQVASCQAGFSFTGPIDTDMECSITPPSSISPFLRAFCCNAGFDAGCVKEGGMCSTGGGLFPSTLVCERGTVCVLDDLGFPALDRPNSGTCRRVNVSAVKMCDVRRCAFTGAGGVCSLEGGVIVTCGAWATRTDGGPKPDCDSVGCKTICSKPYWRKRCIKCRRVKKSCRRGFAFRVRW